jgi:CheY-like chemotaxis protein
MHADSELFRQLRVLVAGPSGKATKTLRAILAALGVTEVVVAEESDAALTAVEAQVFDIVFCDSRLQPLDAVAFALAVRSDPQLRNRRTPVVLTLSATPMDAHAVKETLRSVAAGPGPFFMAEAFADSDRRAGIERRSDADGRPPQSSGERRVRRARRRGDTGVCD